MKQFNRILTVGLFAVTGAISQQAIAAPACSSPDSDSDGDGWGWENGQSCQVVTSSGSSVGSICQSVNSDSDGDGFGWENGQSCIVASASANTTTSTSSAYPSCAQTASDPDGDGFGWENGASCEITAGSAPIGVPSNAGSGSSDGGASNAGSGSSDMGQAGSGSTSTNNGGSFSSGNVGTNIIRSSSLTSSGSNEICTSANGDWFGWMNVGDFILHTNTWAAWASSDYNWSQCIYTNKNGALAGVSYDWGTGRGSGDYQVRSYPELIYGIKDQYRGIAKSITGLPVRVDATPDITIDYSMNWPEYGTPRAVNASANSRYPNGTIIQGERNVSVESFFYNADASGNCSEGIVKRDGGSNHTYEVMVWLNAGAERLPAGPNDYVADVQLDGQPYKVYTKNSDRKYIAFVAQNPQQTGSINWNTYVDWARQNAHQVQSLYGAQTNSVQIQDNWCMANIIVGTEIFWGQGNLDYLNWTITQRQ